MKILIAVNIICTFTYKIWKKIMRLFVVFLLFGVFFSCKERIRPTIVEIPIIEIPKKSSFFPIDTTELALQKDSLVISFYSRNQNNTFWLADTIRMKIYHLINTVSQEGLFDRDFNLEKLKAFEKDIDSLSEENLIYYDVLLTKNLLTYIQKASKGTLNPNLLYPDWDLKENSINLPELLQNFQKKDSFDYAVKSVLPKHVVYKKLKTALKILDSLPKEEFSIVTIEDKIEPTDSLDVLIDIKKKLIFWNDLVAKDSLTPIYDEDTELAIKKFQTRHGLAPDGIIGKGTVKALNFSKKRRKEQVIANMERWRWYPRKFESEYLLVNIPDYSLIAVKNKDTTRNCKVIVGKSKRKTPVLSSKLSYLVLNPTWTVPPTILTEDVLPATKKNSDYLRKKNIKVYDSNNQLIDSTNWKEKEAANYRYVQGLGRHNALGLVKFMFPNRFTIYIHDTNSRAYFDRYNRALSSGCIRVQNPLELAEYLLDDANKWNLKRIKETIKEGKTKSIGFTKDTYIHVFYWTAWSERGTLQFRDDLYGLDKELYQHLVATTSRI